MKTLYIVRHAKSSWADMSLSDFDRPLNERGERDAPRMGKRLKEKRVVPDLMLSSPAKRALATCRKISTVLGYAEEKIVTDKKLYHADEDTLLSVIRLTNDKHDVVLLFGHNPGLTDFANELATTNIDNIPTCGIVACKFQIDSWKEVDWGKGQLLFFDFPKNTKDR
jgi:phosphohistidine phosphatase